MTRRADTWYLMAAQGIYSYRRGRGGSQREEEDWNRRLTSFVDYWSALVNEACHVRHAGCVGLFRLRRPGCPKRQPGPPGEDILGAMRTREASSGVTRPLDESCLRHHSNGRLLTQLLRITFQFQGGLMDETASTHERALELQVNWLTRLVNVLLVVLGIVTGVIPFAVISFIILLPILVFVHPSIPGIARRFGRLLSFAVRA